MMEKSNRLKVVGVHGIGCDHIDLVAASELGIPVCNTPDAITVTVAEMTVGLILALLRRIVNADKAVREGEWNRKYGDLIGSELAGKTVGLIGMGRIGVATAKLLKAFSVNIIYWSRTRKPKLEDKHGFNWSEFEEVLKISDIISLHVPGTTDTFHLIGEKEIELMKKGVSIINTSRGKIIDQKALIKGLEGGKINAAALDVFEKEPLDPLNPLCEMDNVILTPHIGASNLEGMQRMATQVAKSVLKVLQGGCPNNLVAI
jgi:glyoxylate reductase